VSKPPFVDTRFNNESYFNISIRVLQLNYQEKTKEFACGIVNFSFFDSSEKKNMIEYC